MAAIKKLSDQLNVSPILSEILVNRGIDTFDKSRVYFRPELQDLHDPFKMDGMEPAVERMLRALAQKETIVVYGDYDVDGTNGASLVWTFLRVVGANARPAPVLARVQLSRGAKVKRVAVALARIQGHRWSELPPVQRRRFVMLANHAVAAVEIVEDEEVELHALRRNGMKL